MVWATSSVVSAAAVAIVVAFLCLCGFLMNGVAMAEFSNLVIDRFLLPGGGLPVYIYIYIYIYEFLYIYIYIYISSYALACKKAEPVTL